MNTDNWIWSVILLTHHPWNTCLETYSQWSCPLDITWATLAKCWLNHLAKVENNTKKTGATSTEQDYWRQGVKSMAYSQHRELKISSATCSINFAPCFRSVLLGSFVRRITQSRSRETIWHTTVNEGYPASYAGSKHACAFSRSSKVCLQPHWDQFLIFYCSSISIRR